MPVATSIKPLRRAFSMLNFLHKRRKNPQYPRRYAGKKLVSRRVFGSDFGGYFKGLFKVLQRLLHCGRRGEVHTVFKLVVIAAQIEVGRAYVSAHRGHQQRGKARREERDEQLSKMYADPNLAKMEYDFAMYDEETERLVDRAMGKGGQASANPDGDQQLSFLGAADTEGIEEITGNYKP